MPRRKKAKIEAKDLQGFKHLERILEVFEGLREHGIERDKAGNRRLFYDQYAALLLLYYFNPIVDSLRGIQQFSTLEKVQRRLGVEKTSLGSLSEAANVFDPTLLEPIVEQLARRATQGAQAIPPASQAALKGLIAVDGTLLRALPRMAWALYQDETHRGVKVHVSFSVWSQLPVRVSVTEGNGSERVEFRKQVQPGGFYVADRGYADYSLFREIDQAGVRFLIRVQENAVYEVAEERYLDRLARDAGVVKDVILGRLGTAKHNSLLERPLRLVEVQGDSPDQIWVLVTNDLDLPADLVAVAYRYRWKVELFFRWMKCVLGCRHLLSQSRDGVTIQIYLAIIAILLLGLWTGVQPNKRVYEMICFFLAGWANESELERTLRKYQPSTGPPSKS